MLSGWPCGFMAMGKMSETRYPKGDDNSSKPPLERRGADVMSAKVQETDLIGREELREKLDQGDSFKLVMVLGEWEYRAKRIPRLPGRQYSRGRA